MLKCSKCEKTKANSKFPIDERVSTGRSSWCRECRREYQKEYARARRAEPGYLESRKDGARANRVGWYGLSLDDYNQILEKQGGVCAGCGRPPVPGRNLDIDHIHQSQDKKREPWERAPMVRGLLCHLCNRALGILRDRPETLMNLANYLKDPPAPPIILPRFERIVEYLKIHENKVNAAQEERKASERNTSAGADVHLPAGS